MEVTNKLPDQAFGRGLTYHLITCHPFILDRCTLNIPKLVCFCSYDWNKMMSRDVKSVSPFQQILCSTQFANVAHSTCWTKPFCIYPRLCNHVNGRFFISRTNHRKHMDPGSMIFPTSKLQRSTKHVGNKYAIHQDWSSNHHKIPPPG